MKYKHLILFLKILSVLLFIVLFYVSICKYIQSKYGVSISQMPNREERKIIRNTVKPIEKELNKAAKISAKYYGRFYIFTSVGLAEYYQKNIQNSSISYNTLTTDLAQIEFDGDGKCMRTHSCTAKFENSSGKYTVYLLSNGKGVIKTAGYYWRRK